MLILLKARDRRDAHTADMFGTHIETRTRKDGVTQQYHVGAPAPASATAAEPIPAGHSKKFYVTMIRDPGPRQRVARLAGPFDQHEDALAHVEPARNMAAEVDPRAHFDAFGTAGVTAAEHRPGVLNERLGVGKPQHVTDTLAFKRWFGDSKVVDENGKPLVVYHGTDTADQFDAFSPGSFFTVSPNEASAYSFPADFSRRQRATGKYTVATGPEYAGQMAPYYGAVSEISQPEIGTVYATDNGVFRFRGAGKWYVFSDLIVDYDTSNGDKLRVVKGDANDDAHALVDDYENYVREVAPGGDGGRVLPVYLSLQNPVRLPALEANRLGIRLGATREDIAATIAKYESQGYDGIITESDEATMFGHLAEKLGGIPTQYIIFRSEQVKSATGNAGTFDPDHPDITKSILFVRRP